MLQDRNMETLPLEELKRRVLSTEWYHTIDLGRGITTPGHYDHRPYLQSYGFPKDLTGKTALDIGAASGFFSFEMERRGAQVTAADLPMWMGHDFGPAYQPDKTPEEGRRYLYEPFELARSALGSRVEKREINVYDLSPETIGTFDLVFCGSVLLHLTDPVKALWRIRSVTRGIAIIATAIHQGDYHEQVALFAGHHRGDVWWLPNRACLEAMVQSAGFSRWEWVTEFQLDHRDGQPGFWHGVVRAWNTSEGFAAPTTPIAGNAIARPQSMPSDDLRQRLAEQEAEIARLRALVAGYERGRFIRFMRRLREWHRGVRGSR